MLVHLSLQVTDSVSERRHRGIVAVGEFFDAGDQGTADAVHLALDLGGDRGHLFVFDDERFDLILGQLRKLVVGKPVKFVFGILDLLFSLGDAVVELLPLLRDLDLVLGSGIVFDFFDPGGDVRLVDLVG